MITISLCLIVKNEENVIRRCLDSVYDVVDEIIVVDTGSTDNTKKIVNEYTNKIYDFQWNDDFSEARNFSFSKASKEYILWLDADEFLDENNKCKLRNIKSELDNSVDVVTMQTNLCIDENNNPKLVARRNRIIKNKQQLKWVGFIHEYIEVCGICFDSDISIIHDKKNNNSNRNLEIYKKNIEQGKRLTDRDLYYYGKELYCNKFYDESIEILKVFVNRGSWCEEVVDAICKIGECYLYKRESKIAREYFYKTFEYMEPRGDILYNIAYSFEEEKKYNQAIIWYKIVLELPIPKNCNQCLNLSCWRFKPHLNLCCCYFEIEDFPRAYYHHMKCIEINPYDECVISNGLIFDSIIKDKPQKT